MRAQIVAMTSENLDMDAIKRAGDILKAGGLVAFPTETVYGLGGNRAGSTGFHENICSEGKTVR